MAAKRKRSVYHDTISSSDYDTVSAREETRIRVGNTVLSTAAPTRTVTDSWNTTFTWEPPDNPNFALDLNGDLYDQVVEADFMGEDDDDEEESMASTRKGKAKSMVSRRPHVTWMELHRETYLQEMMRWSGRGDFRTATVCPDCAARSIVAPGAPVYRCLECVQPDLVCILCCVRRHRTHPLHWIEMWKDGHFERTTLKSLGLKFQLGHSSMYCTTPLPCHSDMLVLHTNGIHSVAFQYCNCDRATPPHIQLLRRQLYPASQITVKTCATFTLLRQLHKLALTTKASTYDFYRALERLTTSTGINTPKSRYKALMRMNLQWRHLKMLKWGGRGHDDSGASGTKPGELAVLCPSCPRPGINLPEGWKEAPEGMKFLYMMIVCMDANFRLKNNLVSNYSQDPGLGVGLAYMLQRKPYETYVLGRANDEDISTCVGLQALTQANTKNTQGVRYTGTGGAFCGRSEMILPLGIGNLQKGERYANMDYVFGSALRQVLVPIVLISYDIACQWFTNLFKRIDSHWPEEIKPRPGTELIPAIPKLHEPMHQTANHQVYSLNYIKGVGLSDCECPERVWGPHNILGNSTKTQGPGSRQDVLDDHFGFWNWSKYISQGSTLLRRYKAAIAERNVQREGHRGLTEALDPKLVKKWEKMCVEWEGEKKHPRTKTNPYETDGVTISESQVRKELAREEEERLAGGGIALHGTSVSAFVVHALELEDAQRRLRRLSKKTGDRATNLQESTLVEQRNILRTRIKACEQLCPIYMPGLLQHLATTASTSRTPPTTSPLPLRPLSPLSNDPEDALLWLPSKTPLERRHLVCQEGLTDIEAKLRTAQCQDALEGVRHILKIKTRMILFKNRNIRGQRQGTRSRAVIDRVHERARNMAEKYRASRLAKMELDGPGVWEEFLQVLKDEDVRGYQDPNQLRARKPRRGVLEDETLATLGDDTDAMEVDEEAGITLTHKARKRRDGTGETRRVLSWIWKTAQSSSPDDERDDILRAEWAKSRARAARTAEEVLLLKEEMRRVLESLRWKSQWWLDRKHRRENAGKDEREGVQSYAISQSMMQLALAEKFEGLWKSPLEEPDEMGSGGHARTAEGRSGSDSEDDDDDDNKDQDIEGSTAYRNEDDIEDDT